MLRPLARDAGGQARSPTARAATRIDWIDALRGLAILLVFSTHGAEITGRLPGAPTLPVAIGHSLDFGRMGVVLFFAISGFVIPITLKREPGRGLRAFAINRVFRLYPAFWLSIIPSAATHFWVRHQRMALGGMLINATMLPRWLGALMANGGYWTLEVELVFYVICGLLFVGECERKSFVYALLCGAMFFVFLTSQPTIFRDMVNTQRFHTDFFPFHLHLAIMMWGAIIRLWWEGSRVDPLSKLMVFVFGAYWCLYEPCVLAWAYHTGAFKDVDQHLIGGYGGGMLLFLGGAALLRRPPAGLLWIGRISYSLYLFHAPVAIAVVELLLWLDWSPPGIYALAVAAIALLSLGIAHLVFTFVEVPCMRLGHRMARGIAGRKDRQVA